MNIDNDIERRIDEYLTFSERYPHLFKNDAVPSSLKIILERNLLLEKQESFYHNASCAGRPFHWYDLGIVAEDAWVVILRDLVLFPEGNYGGYVRKLNRASEVELKGHDVIILPIVDDRILLLKHFRHEDRKLHLEIPRGFGENGLTASDNAKKELYEELKLVPKKLESIGGLQPDGKLRSQVYFAAYVDNLRDISISNEEGIDFYECISFESFKDKIKRGEIDDPYTINSFAYAVLQGIIP